MNVITTGYGFNFQNMECSILLNIVGVISDECKHWKNYYGCFTAVFCSFLANINGLGKFIFLIQRPVDRHLFRIRRT